jgi:hypothetical protein
MQEDDRGVIEKQEIRQPVAPHAYMRRRIDALLNEGDLCAGGSAGPACHG